jgi:ribosomal protein L35AE/L33A
MNLETRVQDKELRGRQIREKRREARHQADGAVRVEFSNPQPMKIEGRLMDVSASGFRIAHSYAALATGQVVEFSHSEASGHARVMWNRIMDKSVETGFLVIAA